MTHHKLWLKFSAFSGFYDGAARPCKKKCKNIFYRFDPGKDSQRSVFIAFRFSWFLKGYLGSDFDKIFADFCVTQWLQSVILQPQQNSWNAPYE